MTLAIIAAMMRASRWPETRSPGPASGVRPPPWCRRHMDDWRNWWRTSPLAWVRSGQSTWWRCGYRPVGDNLLGPLIQGVHGMSPGGRVVRLTLGAYRQTNKRAVAAGDRGAREPARSSDPSSSGAFSSRHRLRHLPRARGIISCFCPSSQQEATRRINLGRNLMSLV